MQEFLILVNENDQPIGKAEKLMAHQLGLLHRAFSVFVFNSKRELLLQQRADGKYHSAGLWTNTCCSHPKFGEELNDAVKRRLKEEMGLNCDTEYGFNFTYKTGFENGLVEHEIDHVFFGMTDELPIPNEDEVKNWKYINLYELKDELLLNPLQYTVWMRICFDKVIEYFEQNMNQQLRYAV